MISGPDVRRKRCTHHSRWVVITRKYKGKRGESSPPRVAGFDRTDTGGD